MRRIRRTFGLIGASYLMIRLEEAIKHFEKTGKPQLGLTNYTPSQLAPGSTNRKPFEGKKVI